MVQVLNSLRTTALICDLLHAVYIRKHTHQLQIIRNFFLLKRKRVNYNIKRTTVVNLVRQYEYIHFLCYSLLPLARMAESLAKAAEKKICWEINIQKPELLLQHCNLQVIGIFNCALKMRFSSNNNT